MDAGKERKEYYICHIRTIAAERKEKRIFNQSKSVTRKHTAFAFYYIVYHIENVLRLLNHIGSIQFEQ